MPGVCYLKAVLIRYFARDLYTQNTIYEVGLWH